MTFTKDGRDGSTWARNNDSPLAEEMKTVVCRQGQKLYDFSLPHGDRGEMVGGS